MHEQARLIPALYCLLAIAMTRAFMNRMSIDCDCSTMTRIRCSRSSSSIVVVVVDALHCRCWSVTSVSELIESAYLAELFHML